MYFFSLIKKKKKRKNILQQKKKEKEKHLNLAIRNCVCVNKKNVWRKEVLLSWSELRDGSPTYCMLS